MMLSECLHETLQNDERRFIVKQNKTKYSHGENGQVWLALGQIFTTLHLMIHSRAFFFIYFMFQHFGKYCVPSLTIISMKCGFNTFGGTLVEVLSDM